MHKSLPPIIGISGQIRNGKDTVGKMVQFCTVVEDELPYVNSFCDKAQPGDTVVNSPFQTRKFADKLKKYVADLIGCTIADLENQDFKNSELGPEWLVRGKPLTVRELLIRVGNDSREFVHPDIWINALFSSYKEGDRWIITDLRYPNEYERIKQLGGLVVRVNRPGITKIDHISETALNKHQFDYVFENTGSLDGLFRQVFQFCKELKS